MPHRQPSCGMHACSGASRSSPSESAAQCELKALIMRSLACLHVQGIMHAPSSRVSTRWIGQVGVCLPLSVLSSIKDCCSGPCRCPPQAAINSCPTLAALKNPSNPCPTSIQGCAVLEALACPSDTAIDECPTLAALRNTCPDLKECTEVAALGDFKCPTTAEVAGCGPLADLGDFT